MELLQSVWFFLWGLLWAVFFMTGGFDLGVGTLLPFLGKNETDRRLMINAIGPVWDGNEVWLIAAGGVTFAAFPEVYAVMFSSLYTPLMLLLFALIFRGVSFEFRGKVASKTWKSFWDKAIFFGSVIPSFLFGVTFANIFAGIPFDSSGYHGSLAALLNPYGILGGALFLIFFLQHGTLWLAARTTGMLHTRATRAAGRIWFFTAGAVVLFLIATAAATDLYANYLARPYLFILPAAAAASLGAIRFFIQKRFYFRAWFASAATIVFSTFFCLAGLFPNLFPSSMGAQYSLTAFNASSSQLTLTIMLVVVLAVIPIVIGYQIWAYRLFSDKLSNEDLAYEDAY